MNTLDPNEYEKVVLSQVVLADALLSDILQKVAAQKGSPLVIITLAAKLGALATTTCDYTVGDHLNTVLNASDDDEVMRPLLAQMVHLGLVTEPTTDGDSEGEPPLQ